MKFRLVFSLLLSLLVVLAAHGLVLAHGATTVGDYELEIGFHTEPVVVGMPNALDLFVTNTKTGARVNDLQDTLQAEIIFGASKKSLELKPQEGEEGAYTAYVIPAASGDYTWRITGKINDTPVDVSMTSSPDTFDSAEEASAYSFPGVEDRAAATANTALLVAGAGLLAGLAGLVVGLAALRSARRQK